jgi:hypothetical protein
MPGLVGGGIGGISFAGVRRSIDPAARAAEIVDDLGALGQRSHGGRPAGPPALHRIRQDDDGLDARPIVALATDRRPPRRPRRRRVG